MLRIGVVGRIFREHCIWGSTGKLPLSMSFREDPFSEGELPIRGVLGTSEFSEIGLYHRRASEAELKERTLTNLYNTRPTWLANVHEKLDRAVFAAYGWPPDVSDEKILKNLLTLNLERSTTEQSVVHSGAIRRSSM